jgi:hypothetical protein
MTYETMILILAGKSDKVVKQFEKSVKPFVVETRVIRRK